MNSIIISGAICVQPEMKYTAGGLAILEATVAGLVTNVGDDGVVRQLPHYQRVSFFGGFAESICDTLTVGTPVLVTGRLDWSSYERDGATKTSVRVIGNTCNIITGELSDDKRGQPVLENALNQVTVKGNLTRDPILREANGSTVASSSLAVNEYLGPNKERVGFYNVNAWSSLAETVGTGAKGDPVLVQGRLRNSSYEKDGARVYTTEIEAETLIVAQRKSAAAPAQTKSAPRARPPVEDEFPPEEDLPF